MDHQFPESLDENREEASSKGSKKRPRIVLDSKNILAYVATLKPPASRPCPQRRSDRLAKFRNPYGCDRGPVLDPALMRYLCPRTLSARERQEHTEFLKTVPKLISPDDGFSPEAIAACEARRNPPPSPPPRASDEDIVKKYAAQGLDAKAVEMCVFFYGNNPTKVMEFVCGFNSLVGMGFPCDWVRDALVIHENDMDKSLAYLNNQKIHETMPNPFEACVNDLKRQESMPNSFEAFVNDLKISDKSCVFG